MGKGSTRRDVGGSAAPLPPRNLSNGLSARWLDVIFF
jgi:hypothetical protein